MGIDEKMWIGSGEEAEEKRGVVKISTARYLFSPHHTITSLYRRIDGCPGYLTQRLLPRWDLRWAVTDGRGRRDRASSRHQRAP